MNAEQRQILDNVDYLADLMESRLQIPGTPIKFGWDSIVGLIPGVGDLISGAASMYIVYAAWQLGVRGLTLGRMVLNVGLDMLVGSIPIVGDIVDFFWKANLRNVRLLHRELGV